MSVVTAQILVGGTHPNHSGIIPTQVIYLSENSRPSLIMLEEDLSLSTKKRDSFVWIPTVEFMIDDIMLMIGILVLKDEKLKIISKNYLSERNLNRIELYEDIGAKNLKELYTVNKEIIQNFKNLKVVFSIFKESTLNNKLPDLKDYNINIEVCTSKFLRFYSDWSKKIVTEGSL